MHISLRKKTPEPEPEPEAVEEDLADEDRPSEESEQDDGEVLSLPRAFVAAVKGWCAWCADHTSVSVTYWVHTGAGWAAVYYGGWVAAGITVGLAGAVGAFMPRATIDALTARIEAHDQHPAEDPPDTAPEPPRDPLVDVLWQLIGDAPGTHLKTLVERLEKGAAEAGQDPPSKADVEAKLAARNIPLRASVRDANGRVNRGIHGADLKAALAPSPAEPPDTTADP